MKALCLLLIYMHSAPLMAQNFEVQQLNETFDVHRMKVDGVKVSTLKESLPERAEVLSFIGKIGANSQFKGMDVLDQDLFYIRAHKMPAQELEKLYPKLSKKVIAKIKMLASSER